MAQVPTSGNFGTSPLMILTTSTPLRAPTDGKYAKATEEANDDWFHQMRPHLTALSTRGERSLARANRG
jgi:hypothetical protein